MKVSNSLWKMVCLPFLCAANSLRQAVQDAPQLLQVPKPTCRVTGLTDMHESENVGMLVFVM